MRSNCRNYKQNHQTLTLNAVYYHEKYRDIHRRNLSRLLIKDDGWIPMWSLITQSTDEYILPWRRQISVQTKKKSSIMNINLFSEGEEINIAGGAEIRLRIPPEVKDIDSLRLYISDDTVQCHTVTEIILCSTATILAHTLLSQYPMKR